MRKELTPFGERAKVALVEKRMSMEDLAREVGTSGKYLYLIFSGIRPRSIYLSKIADVLEIEPPANMELPERRRVS